MNACATTRRRPACDLRRLAVELLEDRRMLDGAVGQEGIELFDLSPALFVENQGQWADESVRYAFDGSGANVLHTDSGPVFQLFQRESRAGVSPAVESGAGMLPAVDSAEFSVHFDGANPVEPVGLDPAETVYNYYVGDQTSWRTDVPSYETVAYPNLYDGIDLHTWGRRDSLKYEFHVGPGADYRRIRVSYEGIEGLSLDNGGALHVQTELGELVDEAPYVYQQIDGRRVEVAGRFRLVDADTYAFELTGGYDPDRTLVIDPDLAWSSFVGGSDMDEAWGVAADAAGNIFVGGTTRSADFVVGGGYGNEDAFMAKLTAAGALDWATYFGGTEDDRGYDVAVDGGGNALLGGYTGSDDLPQAVNAFHGPDSGYDAFVAKFTGGGALAWTRYVGGAKTDYGYGIAVDAAGNAYVSGRTYSEDLEGRTNSHHGPWCGMFPNQYVCGEDAFVAQVSSAGAQGWATYLGGTKRDGALATAVDPWGNVLVAGWGYSEDIPGAMLIGFVDALAAKFDSSGSLLWARYLGGPSIDEAHDIAADAAGNVLVAGWTSGGFVGAGNPFHGGQDAFVARLTDAGTQSWATYLGGTGFDYAEGVAVDAAGNVLAGVETSSADFDGAGNTFQGARDALVAKLKGDGSLDWAHFLGGSSDDRALEIALDAAGNILVAGSTMSPDFQKANNAHRGGWDGFVAKITDNPAWVVAYYLSHGNNLVPHQQAKFSAIADGAANPNVQPIVLYDFLDATRDAVFEMTAGLNNPAGYTRGTNMWWTSDLGWDPEARMGDDETLSDFMNWVIDQYPAQNYALVLFDHGNGWKEGACWDGGDYLTTGELGTAFAAIDNHLGRNIEVTYLDACLMQMIEVAYEIHEHTDYLVGNVNLGWGGKWASYEDGYLTPITATTSPRDLAVSIATIYLNTFNRGISVSVLDMSRVETVYDAVNVLAQRLIEAEPTHRAEIRSARTDTQKYDEAGDVDIAGDHDIDVHDAYIDLKHFAELIQTRVTGADPAAVNARAAAQALDAVMDNNYIVYHGSKPDPIWPTYQFPNAHGQSIYFPEDDCHAWLNSYDQARLDFCQGTWDEFLRAFLLPRASIDDVSLTEGNGGMKFFDFTVALSRPPCQNVTIGYQTASGTATAGTDYTTVSGVLAILAGGISDTIIIPVLGDTDYELDELFYVNLFNPVATTIAKGQGVGTIQNDDTKLTLSVSPQAFSEGAGSNAATATVGRLGPTGSALIVELESSDTTEATVPAEVTIPAGEASSAPFAVAAEDDEEFDGTQTVTITASSGVCESAAVQIKVTDDEQATLAVVVNPGIFSEAAGAGAATGTVTRDGPTDVALTVILGSNDLSEATVPDSVEIPADSSEATFAVAAVNDPDPDGTWVVTITASATDYQPDSTTVQVTDDDQPVLPTLSIDNVSLTEGDGGNKAFDFTVILSAPSPEEITVDYATGDGTALAGSDYLPQNDTLTIPAFAASGTIIVPVVGDLTTEPDETFYVNLSNAGGAIIVGEQGLGIIRNDDIPIVAFRYIFYNNSAFDGNDPQPNPQDDDAIDPDKYPFGPRGEATFDNYTSYSRGINGIILDIQNLAHPEALNIDTLESYFAFHMGNDNRPVDWPKAPKPSGVAVRQSPEFANAKRVTLVWPDYAIRNTWLKVTVVPGAYTGLIEADTFYFGNAVGESGNSDTDAEVNDTDVALARDNPHNFFNPATVTCEYDYNRDGRVNATDMLIARSNPTDELTALKLIHPAASEGEGAEESAALTSLQRDPSTAEATRENSLGKWAWLYEFEQISPKNRPSEKHNLAEEAVDKLLGSYWP